MSFLGRQPRSGSSDSAQIGQLIVSCHHIFAKRWPPKPEKQLLSVAEVDRKVLTDHDTYAVGAYSCADGLMFAMYEKPIWTYRESHHSS